MFDQLNHKIVLTSGIILWLLTSLVLPSTQAQEPHKIKKAIKNGCLFLTNIQRKNGAIQDTSNALFCLWETIIATRALYETNPDIHDPSISGAMQYLKANENENGLICHNEKCRESYCIETTSEYFILLSKTRDDRSLKEKFHKIITLQNPLGYWEIGNPDVGEQKNFPSVTAFVVNLSSELSTDLPLKELAFSFLEKKQLPDGSFGQHWEYYNTPAYALWQCMKAYHFEKKDSPVFKKAKSFVLSTQKENGCWDFKDTTFVRGVSSELQTALMATCLLNETDVNSKRALSRAIQFLLSRQRIDGSWDGGYFPIKHPKYIKEEYIFATAQTIMLLETFLHKNR